LVSVEISKGIAGFCLIQGVDEHVDGDGDDHEAKEYTLDCPLDVLVPVLLALVLSLLWNEHPARDSDRAGHGEEHDEYEE
jgi:hypothetical protein